MSGNASATTERSAPGFPSRPSCKRMIEPGLTSSSTRLAMRLASLVDQSLAETSQVTAVKPWSTSCPDRQRGAIAVRWPEEGGTYPGALLLSPIAPFGLPGSLAPASPSGRAREEMITNQMPVR